MSKRAAGKFSRRAQDAYDTPPEAVAPLLPHLSGCTFAEPCAGKGDLVSALMEAGQFCTALGDIDPRHKMIPKRDALEWCGTRAMAQDFDYIITNPPWSRDLLHPMIAHFANLRPTWLLFDADWMHTQQAEPYSRLCHKVVSVGRVSWMGNGVSGFDNCCWYFFDASQEWTGTTFFWRQGRNAMAEAAE